MEQVNSPTKVRFGLFEADLQAEELRKSGIRVKVQSQPFKVLKLLLSRSGEIVTREELQQELWGSQTTVDFDHSLGTAINKLREALGDAADNPRFIETLSRRGYRFIAPITYPETVDVPPVTASDTEAGLMASAPPGIRSRGKWIVPCSLVVVLLVVLTAFWFWMQESAPAAPLKISQITFSGRVSPGEPLQENLAATATDGSRIYFSQIEDGKSVLAQTLIADNEISPIVLPSEVTSPSLGDISPDGSKLLVRDEHFPLVEQTLWIVPTLGGAARNFSTIPAHDGTWMPDGQRILYASGTDLYTANEDGSNKQKFASLPDRAFWLRWSPDGSRLRFTLLNKLNHTASLWEISADGKNLHPLLAGWSQPASECCGSWTADGKYYVFQSTHDGRNNLWALREGSWLNDILPQHPIQVTNGPLSYQAPITSRTGEQLFFIGRDTRTVLLRYEPQSMQFVPYGKALNSAQLVTFSRDGQSVAWIRPEDSTLWRSRIDGTQRIQLTTRPMEVFMMHWSPDNSHIVLMGHEPGKLWKLYLVSATGGDLTPLLNESRNEADPGFSPDGNSLVFGRLPDLMAEKAQPKAIYILNLTTKKLTPIPDSEGYFSPRWSPDGRYIVAMKLNQSTLMLYDLATGKWSQLSGLPARDPAWSYDSRWVYFHDFLADDQSIYRVSIPDGHLEHVAGMKSLQPLDIVDFRFAGLAPGDVPLVSARLSTANIYNIDLSKR